MSINTPSKSSRIKKELTESFKTYLNYDIISDERFNDPFDLKRQERVNEDAEKLTNLVMGVIKNHIS